MSTRRSPVLGFNHNVRHMDWLFHVQTEDSGPAVPHVITHLFHQGTILATRKLTYDPVMDVEFVRSVMQAQHKAVLKELKNRVHDETIRQRLANFAPDGFDVDLFEEDVPVAVVPAPDASAEERTDEISAGWVIDVSSFEDPPHSMAPAREVPVEIAQSFKDGAEFLQECFQDGELTGVLLQTGHELPLGKLIVLHVKFERGHTKGFSIQGRVAWHREVTTGNLKPGTGVEFLASDRQGMEELTNVLKGKKKGKS